MPTVHRIEGGLRVVVYPNDHPPPHVHVLGADREAVFNLGCPDGPPELRRSRGFAARELNAVERELQAVLRPLCQAWEDVHGDQR